MRHVAVIGSGPAGYYTAEACIKQFGDTVRVDILDRLPVPYGLIRSGVAPDHQSIKGVATRYEATARSRRVRFVGNVRVGGDVSIAELIEAYDAVVVATGAPADRALGIPGDDLPGVIGSAAFVGWYNGHPDFAGLKPSLDAPGAVVIGAGNVALDVARILAKTRDEFTGSDIVAHALARLGSNAIATISILVRRGPDAIAMSARELGELAHLARGVPLVDPADLPLPAADAALEPGLRKAVSHLRTFAGARAIAPDAIRIVFDFHAKPIRIEGEGRVERVVVERTIVDAGGQTRGTGETYVVPAGLVVSCIGYRTPPIAGIPYDDALGRFTSIDGRIAPGLYAVGWARRGPTGTIGTNRPDGFLIARHIADDLADTGGKPGGLALDRLLADRGVDVVTFSDWQAIERAEIAHARDGAPREKFIAVAEMLAARNR